MFTPMLLPSFKSAAWLSPSPALPAGCRPVQVEVPGLRMTGYGHWSACHLSEDIEAAHAPTSLRELIPIKLIA